jgi:hypothetical protein
MISASAAAFFYGYLKDRSHYRVKYRSHYRGRAALSAPRKWLKLTRALAPGDKAPHYD